MAESPRAKLCDRNSFYEHGEENVDCPNPETEQEVFQLFHRRQMKVRKKGGKQTVRRKQVVGDDGIAKGQ